MGIWTVHDIGSDDPRLNVDGPVVSGGAVVSIWCEATVDPGMSSVSYHIMVGTVLAHLLPMYLARFLQ
jgi:hypothetical protein